ncbi:MAG: deoxyribose-phosphate aldolase [Phycisphaerales bacterium]
MQPVRVDKVMAESRAASFTKRSLKTSTKAAGLRLALSMVDLTTLEGKDTHEKVRSLCRKAVNPSDGMALPTSPGRERGDPAAELPTVAAVCVYPTMVAAARKELNKFGARGENVKVAAVATGFPSGQYPLKVRLEDTRRAVQAGADEIDMVISRGAFLAGEHEQVYDEIRAIVDACGPAHLKVILETGELETLDNVRAASDLAIRAMHDSGLTRTPGAGFIKTSTGKVEPAATMPVTLVMLEAIRDHALATGELVGMKPAGGIRTAKQALHYLVMLKETLGTVSDEAGDAGAYLSPHLFRFGASALVNDLMRQIAWQAKSRYAARYDFAEA